MCGIVALLAVGSQVEPGIVDRMRDRLAHRGPDGAGSWVGATGAGEVGLGHRRLSIIDLGEGGHQPKLSEDGRCVITYNGEVYNYIELRQELLQLGFPFRTSSDTEVLLTAYRAWGAECLGRLNGMFAFAIWDANRQELFVARDRFGEKPLYVARVGADGWAFASEMKALLANPAIPDEINIAYLRDFLSGGMPMASEETPFQAIRRLPPATALRIAADGMLIARWRYWTPTFAPTLRGVRRQALAERFSELLERSLRLRLRSDVEVAACLSGGLDSSLLTAVMAGMGQTQFVNQTFSARFDDTPAISESHFIDLVNARFRLMGNSVSPEGQSLGEECLRLHWHQELPFDSSSMYVERKVMQLAHQKGIKVVVAGQGPDELLGGYQSYFSRFQFDMAKRRRLLSLGVNTLAMAIRLRGVRKRYGTSENRVPVDVFQSMKEAMRAVYREGKDPDYPCLDGVPTSRGGNTLRHLIAQGSLYSILPEQLHSADANSMAFGVEVRNPFLDNEMVEFFAQLPEEASFHNGWQKYLMRQVGARLLPAEIAWRADKIGFSGPQARWLTGPLRDWVERKIASSLVPRILDVDCRDVVAQWESLKSGRSPESSRIWRWISVHHWLKIGQNGYWRNGWSGDAAQDRSTMLGGH